MDLNYLFHIEEGGYIRLPRKLVDMILDYIACYKPCCLYFWMLVRAAYGPIHSSDGKILAKGEIELNVYEMADAFNCSYAYLYRIINHFIRLGILEKKKRGIYMLPMYDKHCNCMMDKKAFVDQSKLQGSFKEFWTVYHRFLNIPETDRYRTERMWAKMSPDEREQALQYIQNYKAYTKGHNYKKSAYNYLKDKMYYTKKE